MIHHHLSLLCALALTATLSAQPGPALPAAAFTHLHDLPGPVAHFATDQLLHCYTVSAQGEVVKYDPRGQEQFRYTNSRLGPLASIDVANPFNVLLYYPDFQTAVTLDRTLNETGRTVFNRTDLMDVPAIGFSNDNQVWVYDAISFQLKKIGRNGQVLARSQDLTLLLGTAPEPTQILARDNYVFVKDPTQGILLFDAFGQFDRAIPAQGASQLQYLDQRLYYLLQGQLWHLDLRTMSQSALDTPAPWDTALMAKEGGYAIQPGRLYLLQGDRLAVWTY